MLLAGTTWPDAAILIAAIVVAGIVYVIRG